MKKTIAAILVIAFNLLSVEDLDKSILFHVAYQELSDVITSSGVVVLALNRTHCIGCEHQEIYSYNKKPVREFNCAMIFGEVSKANLTYIFREISL